MVIISARLMCCFSVILMLFTIHTATKSSAVTIARPTPQGSTRSFESSLNRSPESLHTLTVSTSTAQPHATPQAGQITRVSPTSQGNLTKVLRITWERLIIPFQFLYNIVHPYVVHLLPSASNFDVLARQIASQWTATHRIFTRACIHTWHRMKPSISTSVSSAFLSGSRQLNGTVYAVVEHAQKASSSTSFAIFKSSISALVNAVLIQIFDSTWAAISTATLAIFNALAPDRDSLPSSILHLGPDWALPYIRFVIGIFRVIKRVVILAFEKPHIITSLLLFQLLYLLMWIAIWPLSKMLWWWTGGAVWWSIKASLRVLWVILRASWAVLEWCVGGIWRCCTNRHAHDVRGRRRRRHRVPR